MDLSSWWPAGLAHGAAVRERLVAAYDDPGRGYHDLTHLREVLTNLDTLVPVDHPGRDALRLAAWFHDAVYDGPRAAENEERSARLAERELTGLRAADSLVAEVARLVRITEQHDPEPGDRDGEYLCDADMAILAAPPARYAEYARGVRRDFASIPDTVFRAGRRRLLQDLLERPRLFRGEEAHRRWEARARVNMTAELDRLSAASGA